MRLSRGVALTAVALAIPACSLAARAPTYNERVYITRALPAYERSVPAGCEYLDTRVSASGTYARVDPVYLVSYSSFSSDPCGRYAANGFYLLRRLTATRWVIAYEGSVSPPCSQHFPRDLTSCFR
jgi:hypothetical protein